MLSLVLAAVFGAMQTAAAQEPASAPREELVVVGGYSYDSFYNGFRLSRLIDLPVICADRKPIGPVERPGIRVDQWHVSELVGSKLEIDGDVPVGTVDDIIAGGNDVVKAVVVRDAEVGMLRAVPWRSVVVEPGGERLTPFP